MDEDLIQRTEYNKSRHEARTLERFDVTAEQLCFPAAAQAARLTRFIDRNHPAKENVEEEFIVCSRPSSLMTPEQLLVADRQYWGVESGLNYRLDVSADEDRSRVRTPVAAFNLALFRRAAVSFGIHWLQRCANKRLATLPGFFDAMSAKRCRKALSLVTACKPSWLPK